MARLAECSLLLLCQVLIKGINNNKMLIYTILRQLNVGYGFFTSYQRDKSEWRSNSFMCSISAFTLYRGGIFDSSILGPDFGVGSDS